MFIYRKIIKNAQCKIYNVGYFITSKALSTGRAKTARSPTSTIGRWRRLGFSIIAFIIRSSDTSFDKFNSLKAASPLRKTSNGFKFAFFNKSRSFSSVKGSLK